MNEIDLDGRPIVKAIIEKKTGWITYRWFNRKKSRAQDKVAVFQYFPETDWIVAASFNHAELNSFAGLLR